MAKVKYNVSMFSQQSLFINTSLKVYTTKHVVPLRIISVT